MDKIKIKLLKIKCYKVIKKCFWCLLEEKDEIKKDYIGNSIQLIKELKKLKNFNDNLFIFLNC